MTTKIILHKDLTQRVIGLLYNAFNELGYGYREKYYQRSFEALLKENNFVFKRELPNTLKTKTGKIIGRYFVDFLIDDKVVVELKIANDFYPTHINQLLGYLIKYDVRVGLLALITSKGVKIKRLVN